MNARGDYRVVQVTDSHLFGDPRGTLLGIPTLASFRLVVEEIFEHLAPVDALVLTGDLSQDGTRESYELLRDVIGDFRVPTLCLPGNHDDVAVMREVLSDGQFSCGPLAKIGNWQMLLLNSAVSGHEHGELSDEEFQTLNAALAGGAPTMIFLHHPPVAVGSRWLDTMGLRNGQQFRETLRGHENGRAVVFGHAHQEFQIDEGTRILCCAPSTCLQFKPGTATFALDNAFPGCRVFDLRMEGQLQTHVHRLPLFPFVANREATGY